MNIKIRNTLAEITGALIAITWMWLNLTDALTMSIQSVSKVLAQGIGISIILIIALHIIFNILSSILTGQYEDCLLYTSPSPRDQRGSRMPSSA